MKSKLLTIAIIIVLAFGLIFSDCNGERTEKNTENDRVTITFNIGYAGGENPGKVTIFKGNAAGARWPANPSRSGYKFDGWYKGDKGYTRATVINEDVTVTAKWEAMTTTKPSPPSADLAGLFTPESEANDFPATLSDARKIWGKNNPIITFAYLADPAPMVFCHAPSPCIKNSGDTENNWCEECVLYMYGSNDTLSFTQDGAVNTGNFGATIQGLRVVSTKDLVNWTEHGPLNLTAKNSTHPLFPTPAERPVTYAGDTWAPTAEWTYINGKLKFFLYWCNTGTDTSVVVSDDSPIGPFYNPGLTASMINRSMPNATSDWLFDPGSFIDNDGKIYFVLGGGRRDGSNGTPVDPPENPGHARRVVLNDTMYGIEGVLETHNVPYLYEAQDIWKWKEIYYLNYTTHWATSGNPYGLANIDIAYMKNKTGIMGEFPTDRNDWGGPKKLLPNGAYGDNTNHASLFDFKGVPYLVYHTQSQAQAYGGGRLRVAHLVKINIDKEGHIQQTTMGVDGVEQVGSFNPYNISNEAETVAITAGVYTKHDPSASGGICIASIDTGDWLGVYGVDFDLKTGGASKFNAIVKLPVTAGDKTYTGAIEIRIDPQQQGLTNPQNSARLGTGSGGQTRITGGDVIGRIQLQAEKADEGKWIFASIDLPVPVTGKHNLVFVFYSSEGAALERHDKAVTQDTDARARNVGFEIDKWWFD